MNDLNKRSRFQRKLRSLWHKLHDVIQGEVDDRYGSHEDGPFLKYIGYCKGTALMIYVGIFCLIIFYILKYVFHFKVNELLIIACGLFAVIPVYLFVYMPHEHARRHFKQSSFIAYWSGFSILSVSITVVSLSTMIIFLGLPGFCELKFVSECALCLLFAYLIFCYRSFKVLLVLFRVWLPSFAYLFIFTLLHYAFVLYLHPWFSLNRFLVFIKNINNYPFAPIQ